MKKEYLDVVRLLIRVAPVIFAEPGFALKGGTATGISRLSETHDRVFAALNLKKPAQPKQLSLL